MAFLGEYELAGKEEIKVKREERRATNLAKKEERQQKILKREEDNRNRSLPQVSQNVIPDDSEYLSSGKMPPFTTQVESIPSEAQFTETYRPLIPTNITGGDAPGLINTISTLITDVERSRKISRRRVKIDEPVFRILPVGPAVPDSEQIISQPIPLTEIRKRSVTKSEKSGRYKTMAEQLRTSVQETDVQGTEIERRRSRKNKKSDMVPIPIEQGIPIQQGILNNTIPSDTSINIGGFNLDWKVLAVAGLAAMFLFRGRDKDRGRSREDSE